MHNLVNDEIDYIDIQVDVIDQAIIDLENTISKLSGENAYLKLEETRRIIEEKLSGEYEKSLNSTFESKKKEMEICILNATEMLYILKVYREYLRSGPNSKINENLKYIKIEPTVMKYHMDDFEQTLEIQKPKLKDNKEVRSYVKHRRRNLEDEIKRKQNHKPEPLDASHEIMLLSILNNNGAIHESLEPKIEKAIYEMEQLKEEINHEIKVLKEEVGSYHKLWDKYENKDLKVITYNNVNYSLSDIEELSALSPKELTDSATTGAWHPVLGIGQILVGGAAGLFLGADDATIVGVVDDIFLPKAGAVMGEGLANLFALDKSKAKSKTETKAQAPLFPNGFSEDGDICKEDHPEIDEPKEDGTLPNMEDYLPNNIEDLTTMSPSDLQKLVDRTPGWTYSKEYSRRSKHDMLIIKDNTGNKRLRLDGGHSPEFPNDHLHAYDTDGETPLDINGDETEPHTKESNMDYWC